MATRPVEQAIREQLVDRRSRIAAAIEDGTGVDRLVRLLGEVDSALERIEQGSYGICVVCHEPIDSDRMLADPLACACLSHLTEAEQRALEHDIELASRVQARLLPARRIERDGWSVAYETWPAGPVGGDTCDVIADGDELTVLVGDVAGKGIAAAMLGTHLHALARTLLAPHPPLADLVGDANRFFAAGTLASHYVTLAAVRATGDGSLEIVNAGHCPPLVVRRGGVDRIPSTGLPIGLFDASTYATCSISLAPGDALVLYTDGVIEASADGETDYGTDRLAEVVGGQWGRGAGEMLQACLDDHRSFLGSVRRHDDLTLLVLQRR